MMARTLILSITMGKVDGCRLWSTRLTGGSVYPDYPAMPTHIALLLFKSTGYPLHPRLWKQFHRQTKQQNCG